MEQNTPTQANKPVNANSNPDSQSGKPKSSKKTLIWILVSVGVLLIAGIIVIAVYLGKFGKFVGKTVSEQSNIISSSEEDNGSADELISFDVDDPETETYLNESAPVFAAIEQSIGLWSEAADFGVAEDFENSTAKLEEGLAVVKQAEETYAGLTPSGDAQKLHELVGKALELSKRAMESGISGNKENNEEKIGDSGQAITELSDVLLDIATEIDKLTGLGLTEEIKKAEQEAQKP